MCRCPGSLVPFPCRRLTAMESSLSSLSLHYAVFCVVDMVGLFPVIALPRAIINCGWLGLPLALVVFMVQIYTAILLGRSWIIGEQLDNEIVKKKRRPYGALVELAYGKRLGRYVTIILDLSIFGAFVPDLLIAAQNLQVIGLKASRNEFDFSYCYWLLIIGALVTPIMLLGSPKDMKFIGVTSVSVVLLTSVLTWASILSSKPDKVEIPQPSWESTGIAYGTLAFQFDVHPMILSVQMDMKNKKDVGKAVIMAFIVSGSLFLVTTVLCYTTLGDRTHYNTLESLPQSGLLDLALALATLQVCLSMAVGSTPFFQDLEHSLRLPPVFGWRRVAMRSLLVGLAVLLGETVPRFDLLMGLVGGSLTGQLIFFFPPLVYRELRRQLAQAPIASQRYGTFSPRGASLERAEPPEPWPARLRAWLCLEEVSRSEPLGRTEELALLAVPLLGVIATCLAVFFSLRETLEYAEYSPSCFLNLTFPHD